MFFKKKKDIPSYDPEREEPAVKKSICTGEATVGFVDKTTGRYRDVIRITSPSEADEFCKSIGYDPAKIKTIY